MEEEAAEKEPHLVSERTTMKPKRPTKTDIAPSTQNGMRTGCLFAILFAVVLWVILAVAFFAVSYLMK